MAESLEVNRTRFVFEPPRVKQSNASGEVLVGGSRFVFIDNRKPLDVFELTLKPDGTQQGPVRTRPIVGLTRAQLSDPEGLTLLDVDGARYLVAASSLSVPPVPPPAVHRGLVRIR